MNTTKNLGITLIVIAAAIGFWVYSRMTSLAGKLHSWSPPFSEYEVYTLVGAGIAVLLLIVGIQKCSEKTVDGAGSSKPQAAQGGGLDFRTLSKFIAVLGVAVACYGGFRYRQNMPLPEPPPDSGQFKGWSDFLDKTTDPTKNAMGVALINSDRSRARTDALKIMGVGAAIVFAAFAIERSTRRA